MKLAAAGQRVLLARCLEMQRATLPVLRQGVTHPDPTYRYAAALAIGRRRLPLKKELIALLDDDNVYVQQMARQSLVKASKGKDYGPLPYCECEQVQESVSAWKKWAGVED